METNGQIDGRAVLRQVWSDSWKNIVFFGAAVPIIALVGSYVRWLGLVLFAGFTVITLIDVLRLLFVAGLSMLMLPIKVVQSVMSRGVAAKRGLHVDCHPRSGLGVRSFRSLQRLSLHLLPSIDGIRRG